MASNSPCPDLSAMLKSPQAEAVLKDTTAIRALMNSPEGRTLSRLLQCGEGELKDAAASVRRGDPAAIQGLIGALSRSEEGADLIRRLQEHFGT